MKRFTLLFITPFFVSIVLAQPKVADFGKIDKSDFEIKDCDFDPGADALALFDVGDIQFAFVQGVGWQSESEYHVRIKVLNKNGIHRSNIKIQYYTVNRQSLVSNVSAASYNINENGVVTETKLEKKDIYKKDIDSETSEISFALPDVKAGTIFEYKYEVVVRSFGYIPKWLFQTEIPVKYSAYHVILPQYFQYTVQTIKRQPLEQKDTKTKGTWYIMRNIPGIKREPCSRNLKDYQQYIEFQLTKIDAPNYYNEIRNTWPKIINELLESEAFGGVLKKKIKRVDDLDVQLENVQQVKDKIRIIYKYVQAGMQWNNEYSKYPQDGAIGIKETWRKKTGNTADINFILVKLLQSAGIDAKPLLVSTRENGTINTEYPFIMQFNAVFVYIKDGNSRYVLNAADKKTPYNFVPEEVLYTNALVVDKDAGGLVGLNSQVNYSQTVVFSAGVDDNGKATGEAFITNSGYAKADLVNGHNNNKLKEVLEEWGKNVVTVDTVVVKNITDETLPAIAECKFYKPGQQSGDYYFLPCTIFTSLDKNPFSEESRIADIDFIYPRFYTFTGTYRLQESIEVSSLPRNAKMILPDTSIVLTRMVQQDENIISLKLTVEFKSPSYSSESYPYIKYFFTKMYELLREQIVLKKIKSL